MVELASFFVLLCSGLFFSALFKRLHLPYVTALIVAGMIIGPVFNLVSLNEPLSFLGAVGLVFLMFIAGSEIKIETFKRMEKAIFVLAFLNGVIPFAVGIAIGLFLKQSLFTGLVLGVAFMSSSVAVIIPSLESRKIIETDLGETIVSATVLEDIGSLLLLSFILQSVKAHPLLPLPIYIPVVIGVIFLLKKFIPKLQDIYHYRKRESDFFESRLQFVFVVLIATVLLFEFIGMHAIVAGFLIGILLGDSIKGQVEEKIRTISYGLFIPIFFLIVGMQTNLSIFLSLEAVITSLLIIAGLISAKVASGFIAGKFALHFSAKESLFIGLSTIPQLSTTLAIAFVALEFGLLPIDIITSLIILSTVTVFIAPMAIRYIKVGQPEAMPW
ncbi:MAG: cation:proton antiporter [Candidatus Diapherotrites archaeon]|uniref:Cation:proton antiporter n=1 Tax=Candidatus Iainarchaeum sp. TaxID=3101447 RepID=A0A938YX93_9ARCH|nr:cation:proton antiporter [Candidatus Diapherotrites archaeon]